MKVIIEGFQHGTCHELVSAAIAASGFEITEVISGGGEGVGQSAIELARDCGIRAQRCQANWFIYRDVATEMRNARMVEYADAVILIWDGECLHTKDLMEQCVQAGLTVFNYSVK